MATRKSARTQRKIYLSLVIAALAAAGPAHAEFIADSTLIFDVRLRLRFEGVDDDDFSRDADALTQRTRFCSALLGWRSGSVQGFYVLAEEEDVRALDESYNSTANGRGQYPMVVDPEGSEWNQALLGCDSGSGSVVQAGRQRLAYDNLVSSVTPAGGRTSRPSMR